ncbi:MAG: site-2 protease family protein [Burkholderiales bacterium]|jgi:Zn-dependent protease
MPSQQGAIRLFRLAGIDVFLHWSWFVVALFEFQVRGEEYSSPLWNALEYLTLFAIVTLHEFGHSLACRQVGGSAERIVLWPLGGVAYVAPPQRPGATLWSLAAGPLVNVALVPVLLGIGWLGGSLGWPQAHPNLAALLLAVFRMNLGLLIFNLLPVYPLDGGQILRSLLWFGLGRARSLMIATLFGFLGVAALGWLALQWQSVWIGIMAAFVAINCWSGFQQARLLSKVAKVERRHGFACPSCGSEPPLGDVWGCARCGQGFDVFEFDARCPACGESFGGARCIDCNRLYPLAEWARPPGP